MPDSVRMIPPSQYSRFSSQYTSCLIITSQGLLVQQRGEDWNHFPGWCCSFGGKIEAGESPTEAILRELKEELALNLIASDLTFLGAITEPITQHQDLIHCFFWRCPPTQNITECYEGKPRYFETPQALLATQKVTDDTIWAVQQYTKI